MICTIRYVQSHLRFSIPSVSVELHNTSREVVRVLLDLNGLDNIAHGSGLPELYEF